MIGAIKCAIFNVMVEDQRLLEAWKRYVESVGPDKAHAQLTNLGVSARTADPLVDGTYNRKPSRMLRKHLRDLAGKELKAS